MTASLLVRHLHEGGWDSHVIELRLTANALLLNGSQQFTNASGIVGGYCIFPAEIPLESIVNVQAVPGNRFVDAVKLFSIGSHVESTLFHLEYRDDRGRAHTIDFIPADAQQVYNEWSGGDQDAVKQFAADVKSAINLRLGQLHPTAPTSNAPPEASPTDPVTGEAIAPPDSKNVPPANGVEPNTELPPPTPRFFRAQMCWPSTCRRVTVWPISPADAGRLRVIDDATGNLLVDMPRVDISKVQVKRKTIVLRPPPPPGQMIITWQMPTLGPAQAPKVYELCFHTQPQGGKGVTQCFISDLAACGLNRACQEGSDSGRHVLDMEKQIGSAMQGAEKP